MGRLFKRMSGRIVLRNRFMSSVHVCEIDLCPTFTPPLMPKSNQNTSIMSSFYHVDGLGIGRVRICSIVKVMGGHRNV